jgi:thiol-disulfide isomerase/thioredoxin
MNSAIFTFLIISIFIIISCNNHKESSKDQKQKVYRIIGKIQGRDSGLVYLGIYDTSKTKPLIIIDSANVLHSDFEFTGKLQNSMPGKIMIKNFEQGWPYTHYFILDTGLTKVQLFKDSMGNSIITGSASQEQFIAFNKKLYDLEISFQKNFPLYKEGIITSDSFNKIENAFNHKKYDLILNQVKSNPSSVVSSFIAQKNISDEIDFSTFNEICNLLKNKDNYFARYLLKLFDAKKQTSIGIQAPYFRITDSKNKILTKDSFKGKYLLLDFWASWCVPCRDENPNLVKAYKKFKSKKFEIISISSDMDKRNWENAIKKDKLTWIQACDLQGPKSKIIQDFGVLVLPTNFLVDEEGRIIAKDLSGEELEKVLAGYLK